MNATGSSRLERVLAWGSLILMIAATIAAVWIVAGTVFGLLALAAFAGATGWCAVRGELIR